MKKLASAALACCALLSSGCAGLAFAGHHTNGSFGIFSSTQANEAVTQNGLAAAKSGEACSGSLLGLITWGDSSVATAARGAGISKVASVDNKYTQVLGIYASYCLVVTGE